MAEPVKIRVVVVVAFEPDGGPVPGELSHWIARNGLTMEMPFAAGYRPLRTDGKGLLAVVTGVGAARAAASVMALGLDARFDLTGAYWVVNGVAGIDPARGSLGSAVWCGTVVDGGLVHEIDGREIPGDWPDGFVPIGKSVPYEEPREDRFNGDDGIVFELDARLAVWAFELTRGVALVDTSEMAARRVQFRALEAWAPPSVLMGAEVASSTFWHGRRMSERARAWVRYQTSGRAEYCVTGMEDAGILQALQFLASAGRVDFGRILVLRGASNYDQQRVGISAAESLAESKVAKYSGYRPALENLWRVGNVVVEKLLGGTPTPPEIP